MPPPPPPRPGADPRGCPPRDTRAVPPRRGRRRHRGRSSQAVRAVALEHVAEIDQRLAELASMRRLLVELMDHCHGDARPECPILDDLAGADAAAARALGKPLAKAMTKAR